MCRIYPFLNFYFMAESAFTQNTETQDEDYEAQMQAYLKSMWLKSLGAGATQSAVGGAIGSAFNMAGAALQNKFARDAYKRQVKRQDFLLNHGPSIQMNSFRNAGLSTASMGSQFSPVGTDSPSHAVPSVAPTSLPDVGNAMSTFTNTRLAAAQAKSAFADAQFKTEEARREKLFNDVFEATYDEHVAKPGFENKQIQSNIDVNNQNVATGKAQEENYKASTDNLGASTGLIKQQTLTEVQKTEIAKVEASIAKATKSDKIAIVHQELENLKKVGILTDKQVEQLDANIDILEQQLTIYSAKAKYAEKQEFANWLLTLAQKDKTRHESDYQKEIYDLLKNDRVGINAGYLTQFMLIMDRLGEQTGSKNLATIILRSLIESTFGK